VLMLGAAADAAPVPLCVVSGRPRSLAETQAHRVVFIWATNTVMFSKEFELREYHKMQPKLS
jgi:hypothetical protein